MRSNEYITEKYLRNLPTKFCSGCGNGIILNCFARAVDNLGLDRKEIVCVSGIGCSSWIPSPYFRSDTMHVTHGRAIPFATGIKIFNPKLKVVVFTGDGDGAGIGGNHLIHAARRDIDLMVILVNNRVYGMTGGQVAPTTQKGAKTETYPEGNPEPAFDLVKLVSSAGARFCERTSTFYYAKLIKTLEKALEFKGFSFVEVLSQCPTYYGSRNNLKLKELLESLE
ncbi:MAG: thiamine pyrophosphate-dependent enzyme [Candidatus Methanofastidiosia archaeon]